LSPLTTRKATVEFFLTCLHTGKPCWQRPSAIWSSESALSWSWQLADSSCIVSIRYLTVTSEQTEYFICAVVVARLLQ
jgi:hypothetical protein